MTGSGGSDEYLANVRSGPFRVVYASTLFSYDDQPIWFDVGLPEEPRAEWLTIQLSFNNTGNETPTINVSDDDSNPRLINLILTNFNDGIGTTIQRPLPFGTAVGLELFVGLSVRKSGKLRLVSVNVFAQALNGT